MYFLLFAGAQTDLLCKSEMWATELANDVCLGVSEFNLVFGARTRVYVAATIKMKSSVPKSHKREIPDSKQCKVSLTVPWFSPCGCLSLVRCDLTLRPGTCQWPDLWAAVGTSQWGKRWELCPSSAPAALGEALLCSVRVSSSWSPRSLMYQCKTLMLRLPVLADP